MDVRNCRNCGRLFNVLAGERLCPACMKAVEDKFQDVKIYINEHTNASVDEVARENDVSVKQIRQWVREERLSFSDSSVEGIECEKCGKLIRTGRFCEDCKKTMMSDLNSVMDKPKPAPPVKSSRERDKDRMRYLQNKS